MDGSVIDVYREPFGVRTVKITEKQLFINDRPFYCHGVAKHEDADVSIKLTLLLCLFHSYIDQLLLEQQAVLPIYLLHKGVVYSYINSLF